MKTIASDHVDLPDKLYFKIGEVAEIANVPTYVLRFWETEFGRIKPKRTRSGQRLYRKNDVELILNVKNLLYDQKYTIKGAKQHLFSRSQTVTQKSAPPTLKEIRTELEKIRDLLA